MKGYRLLTYISANQGPEAGILVADRVHAAAPLLAAAGLRDVLSTDSILQHWEKAHSILREAGTADPSQGIPLGEVTLLAPLAVPGELLCAGANYWDHLREMADIAERTTGKRPSMSKPAEPWFFLKNARSGVIGSGADVALPRFSQQVDWEAELAVIIGRTSRNISEERALECVAGYTILNDLSARDLMKREGTPFIYDWVGQKCFQHSAPMGPWITPAEYVGDPENLSIKLWVNGVLKQNSNTKQMVHSAREQIAYLSRHFTLHPGDIIATGTPAGVGMPRGEFLKPGDEVKIEIENCGVLLNRMVAESVP
jgi:2-keto-4-pentenoate hydratase/2-oxohepta-3-ene-1,7-dioic acid hydratase in catechol pathway